MVVKLFCQYQWSPDACMYENLLGHLPCKGDVGHLTHVFAHMPAGDAVE